MNFTLLPSSIVLVHSSSGSTPNRDKAYAPTAAASVNVAGSATGIEARTAVKTRGIISTMGILCQ